MKAIVIAPLAGANAVLPDLTYDIAGVPSGGFTLVGNVPQPDTFTCFVRVHTSEATLNAMMASGDYVFVEEVVEGDAEIVALSPPNPPAELPGPAALRIWLIQQGYSPSIVAGTIPNQADEVLAGLQALHQVSEVEYGRAWH